MATNSLTLVIFAILGLMVNIPYASGLLNLVPTVSELKFVLNKGGNQEKIFGLSALANNTQVKISSSDLFDKESGKLIPGESIRFNETDLVLIKDRQQKISASFGSNDIGTYHGNIIMHDLTTNNISKIPFSAIVNDDLTPVWVLAIAIFSSGFFISLGFYAWRSAGLVSKKFSSLREESKDINVEKNIYGDYISKFEGYLPLIDLWLYETLDIMNTSSNVDEAEERMNHLKEIHTKMMDKDNFDIKRLKQMANLAGYSDIKEFVRLLTCTSIELKKTKEDSKNFSDIDPSFSNIEFSYWKYLNNPGRFRSMILFNITSIILGLVIALGSMLQQDYFKSLTTIDAFAATILFTLGAATDNVKQIIERIANPKSTE